MSDVGRPKSACKQAPASIHAGNPGNQMTINGSVRGATNPFNSMAHIVLAIFLIVFGLNVILGLALPGWVLGGLALVAGILLLVQRFTIVRKP
jgi:hypothetical protein